MQEECLPLSEAANPWSRKQDLRLDSFHCIGPSMVLCTTWLDSEESWEKGYKQDFILKTVWGALWDVGSRSMLDFSHHWRDLGWSFQSVMSSTSGSLQPGCMELEKAGFWLVSVASSSKVWGVNLRLSYFISQYFPEKQMSRIYVNT